MEKIYLRYTLIFVIISIIAGCSKREVYTFKSGNTSYHKKENKKGKELEKTTSMTLFDIVNDNEVVFAANNNSISVTEENTFSLEKAKKPSKSVQKETLTELIETEVELNGLQKRVLKKIQKKASKESSGDSQLIALLLCWFMGGLGIHRFYLGYTTEGILQLLTAGGCGIWWLIDLIRIITGDLGPKDGEYTETL